MNMLDNREVESITLSAVVIRADGRREDHGVIAQYKHSWFTRITNYWRKTWQHYR